MKFRLLFFILTATVSLSANDTDDRSAAVTHLSTLAKLTVDFMAAHDGRFPASFDELLAANKTADKSILISPLATDRTKPSYELLLAGKRLSQITNPSRTIQIRSLFTTKDGRRLVSCADGHVEFVTDKL